MEELTWEKKIKTKDVAKLLNTSVLQIQGSIRFRMMDIGFYMKKPGAVRGSYVIVPSKLAAQLNITEKELKQKLEAVGW